MNRRILIIVMTGIISIMLMSCGKKENVTFDVDATEESVAVQLTETNAPSLPEGEGTGEGPALPEDVIDFSASAATESESIELGVNRPKSTEPKVTEPKATEVHATEPTPTEAKPSDSDPTEPKPTESKPTEPKPTEPPVKVGPCCEYDKYLSMSPAEQEAYMSTFSNPLEFIQWSQDAEAEHKAHDDTINIEGGDLNIGDFME